ncbi:MAG: ABC-F family ATP-binding cassette domain-containing protein [Erysipelotrichaceae bacterium]|nr:ABC-F family ATP-binding cassette domain-containing protein [Erysipelotrichaceae bacterium]
MLITIKNLTKTLGDRTIIKDSQLIINDNDKIGIIGRNGVGKSTLLKIVAKIEPYDHGEYIKGGNISIGYLPQMPSFIEGDTCYSYIVNHLPQKNHEVKEYEIKTILSKLGLNDYDTLISTLSGGQKKKVALALSLLLPCDLLILDEPTNHLDQDMIIWLENYLKKYKGAILMVTHDRYFLENICTKMVELDRLTLTSYEANYSKYLEQKEELERQLLASDHKRQQFLKKELEWVRAGVQARSTKSKSRLQRFEELSKVQNYTQAKDVDLSSIASRMGNKTIELHDLVYTINNKTLINHFTYQFLRFDRVGIVGKNGIGKSTLLNLISQKLTPTSGNIELGTTIKIGYFSQEIQGLDESKRVIDIIKEYVHEFESVEGMPSAKVLLEQFLFNSSLQHTYVHKLSGGEKRRLYLLTILLTQPNVLILDEPTNDLDIASLNVLENFLDDFKGIVIVVSHDRYFLDRVVDKIFAFENDGHIQIYNGGFSDYFNQRQVIKESKKTTKTYNKPKKTIIKMTYQERKEFETIEQVITELENQLTQVEKQLNNPEIEYNLVMDLVNQRDEIETQLLEKMDRWQYLSELDEKSK